VLLKISAEHTSAVVAREIANAAAAAFADQVPVLEQVAGTAESPVEATVVRPAGLGARTQPGARLNIALGLVLGAISGFGAVVLRDRLDHTVRAEELEDLLGLPLLGRISGGDGVERDQVICLAQPSSRPAEEFRSVRTNLRFADADELPRSIVVTSALDGEGTAGVLGNLAVVLAQAGDPVVVVCADLRHPRLDELVRVHRRPGLTSVLSGHATLDEALQRWGDPALPLWALAPGPLPGNPSEVLGSKELELLIRRLEDRATFVLIETPPALPFTDAAVVSAIASGVVLVARSGRTPHDDVSSAVRALRAVGARLYGAVVTTPPRRLIDLGDTTSATTPRREEP
ncbi:MAG TPA: CpsD/CapB family tyrosine-protein kinase, partial [Acidimicrobiales bacterium]|nr:CpsD/CapB family tyrosine-protein kinase [Acidimicrobiales bacterium]